jgi:hypothetical protein
MLNIPYTGSLSHHSNSEAGTAVKPVLQASAKGLGRVRGVNSDTDSKKPWLPVALPASMMWATHKGSHTYA